MNDKPPSLWVAILLGLTAVAVLGGALWVSLALTGGVRQQVVVWAVMLQP